MVIHKIYKATYLKLLNPLNLLRLDEKKIEASIGLYIIYVLVSSVCGPHIV